MKRKKTQKFSQKIRKIDYQLSQNFQSKLTIRAEFRARLKIQIRLKSQIQSALRVKNTVPAAAPTHPRHHAPQQWSKEAHTRTWNIPRIALESGVRVPKAAIGTMIRRNAGRV
eukprot:COSAG01_NODE_3015_length_6719_cov_129.305996_6_plen_113_part_00